MPAKSHAEYRKPAGVGYPAAAVQSVSVTTNSPRNPLSALGYKGVVGFIKQPETADVTVEEFLPLNLKLWTTASGWTAKAVGGGSVSLTEDSEWDVNNPAGANTYTKLSSYAVYVDSLDAGDLPTIAGATECVLNGVTFNFTAGQPGRVTWSFLGRGGNAQIDETTPLDGTGTEKEVLLWENVNLTNDSLSGYLDTPVSGVQSVTFTGQINKDTLFALGTSGVYQHVTTFPINVTVSVESYGPLVGGADGTTVPAGKLFTDASGHIAVGPVKAIECRLSSKGQSVNVGGYLTNTEQYTAADLAFVNPS